MQAGPPKELTSRRSYPCFEAPSLYHHHPPINPDPENLNFYSEREFSPLGKTGASGQSRHGCQSAPVVQLNTIGTSRGISISIATNFPGERKWCVCVGLDQDRSIRDAIFLVYVPPTTISRYYDDWSWDFPLFFYYIDPDVQSRDPSRFDYFFLLQKYDHIYIIEESTIWNVHTIGNSCCRSFRSFCSPERRITLKGSSILFQIFLTEKEEMGVYI